MKSKVFFAIGLFAIVLVQQSSAQNSTYRHHLYAGQGYSLTGALFNNFIPDSVELAPISRSSKPAWVLNYDYGLSKRWSLGMAASYQQLGMKASGGAVITFIDDVLNPQGQDFSADINRVNIAVRPLFHYIDNERIDIYSGVRLGVTIWTKHVTYAGEKAAGAHYLNRFFAPQIIPFGVRYYFLKHRLGVGFETGFGAPTYFNWGVNFRF